MSKRTYTDYSESEENTGTHKAEENVSTPQSDKVAPYTDESATTPAGPYSYAAEKRAKLFDRDHASNHKPRDPSKPQVDPQFGQQGAFPTPSSPDPADEAAWSYLRAVRAEAEGLPSIYRGTGGPDTSIDEDGGLIFDDGACIAAPRVEVASSLPARQVAYYTALLGRFRRHRVRMVEGPSADGDEIAAGKDLVEKCGPGKAAGGLSQAAVLRLLIRLDERLDAELSESTVLPAYLGLWAWTLLGQLEGPGGLSSEEVGVVRDLAKRCAWGMSWAKVSGEQISGDSMGMMEMVVTVVGEVWGQRDLLEGRAAWDE